MSDWKQHHANEADKSVGHPIVERVVQELLRNLGEKDGGLPAYGIRKVAAYAAQVARAQALGFDPELLRMSEEEAEDHALRIAEAAALSGKPVWVIATEGGEGS